MRFYVLGALRVVDDGGRELQPACRHVAELISILAIRDTWVDPRDLTVLMGFHRARSVHRTVRLARAYLGDEDRLVHQRGKGYGYLLDVRLTDWVDLEEFRRHRDQGIRAQDRGDLRAAVTALASALDLWEERPLRSLPSTSEAEAAITHRLLRERDDTTCAWIHGQLRLGNYPVAELAELAAHER